MECGFLLAVGLQERDGLKARPQALSSRWPPCFLGVPNSSYMVTIELTGADAVNVCNNLSDPIRTIRSLEATWTSARLGFGVVEAATGVLVAPDLPQAVNKATLMANPSLVPA